MYFSAMYMLISQGVSQLGGVKYTHMAVASLLGIS